MRIIFPRKTELAWHGKHEWVSPNGFGCLQKKKKRARAVTYRNALCVGHVFKRQSGRSHAWYDCCCCCLYYAFSFIWMCSFTYIFFGVRRTPGGSGAYATTTTTPIDRQYKQVLSIPSCRAEHTQFDAWATAMWAHHKSEVNTFASIGTHTHTTKQNNIHWRTRVPHPTWCRWLHRTYPHQMNLLYSDSEGARPSHRYAAKTFIHPSWGSCRQSNRCLTRQVVVVMMRRWLRARMWKRCIPLFLLGTFYCAEGETKGTCNGKETAYHHCLSTRRKWFAFFYTRHQFPNDNAICLSPPHSALYAPVDELRTY